MRSTSRSALAAHFISCVDDVVAEASLVADEASDSFAMDEKRASVRAVCSALEHCAFDGLAAEHDGSDGFWGLITQLATKERAVFEPCVLLTEMLSLKTGRGFCRAWLRQSLLRSSLAYMLRLATHPRHAAVVAEIYAPHALLRDPDALAALLVAIERLASISLQLKTEFRQLDEPLQPLGTPQLRPRAAHPTFNNDAALLDFDLGVDRKSSRKKKKKRGGRRRSSAAVPAPAAATTDVPNTVSTSTTCMEPSCASLEQPARWAPPTPTHTPIPTDDPTLPITRALAARIAAYTPVRGVLVPPSRHAASLAPRWTRPVDAVLAPRFAVRRHRAAACLRSHRAARLQPRARLNTATPEPPAPDVLDMRSTAAVVVSAEVTAQYTVFIVRVLARRHGTHSATASLMRYAWYVGKSYDSFAALHRHLATRFGRDAVPRLPVRKFFLFEKRRSEAVTTTRSAELTLYLQRLLASPLRAAEAVQRFVTSDCIDVAEKMVEVTVGGKCAPNARAALKKGGPRAGPPHSPKAGGKGKGRRASLQVARALPTDGREYVMVSRGSSPRSSSGASSRRGSRGGSGTSTPVTPARTPPPGSRRGGHEREWSRSLAIVDASALAELAAKLSEAAAGLDLAATPRPMSAAQRRSAKDQAEVMAALSEQLEAGQLSAGEYSAQVAHYTRLWERLESSRVGQPRTPPPPSTNPSPAAPQPQMQVVVSRLRRMRAKQPMLFSVTGSGVEAIDPARSSVAESWALSDVKSFTADSRDVLAFAIVTTSREVSKKKGGNVKLKDQRHRFEVVVEADRNRLLAALNYHRRRQKLGEPWTI